MYQHIWLSHTIICWYEVIELQFANYDHTSHINRFVSPADIIVTTNGDPVTSKEIKSCIHQIQELIVVRLNQAVANKLISSVDYLRESFVGTLERCLNSLEKSNFDSSAHNITSNHLKQVKKKVCETIIFCALQEIT